MKSACELKTNRHQQANVSAHCYLQCWSVFVFAKCFCRLFQSWVDHPPFFSHPFWVSHPFRVSHPFCSFSNIPLALCTCSTRTCSTRTFFMFGALQFALHLTHPSAHTHTVNTHPEQWTANAGASWGFGALLKGHGLFAAYSLPDLRLETTTFGLQVRLSIH